MVKVVRNIVAVIAVVVATILCDRAMAQEYSYPFLEIQDESSKLKMEWGVGVGGVYTGVNHVSAPDVTLRSRLGFEGHLNMGVVFGKHFAVESELLLQKARLDTQKGEKIYDVHSTTLMMPIMLSLRMWDETVRFSGGVSFGILSNGDYLDGRDIFMFGAITPTWNLAAKVGVYVARMVLVELRYSYALQDNINQLGGRLHQTGVDFATRTNRVSLGATILF